jgi:hypothetical protein
MLYYIIVMVQYVILKKGDEIIVFKRDYGDILSNLRLTIICLILLIYVIFYK